MGKLGIKKPLSLRMSYRRDYSLRVVPMLYLNHPPLRALIASLPVAESAVEVRADRWRRACEQAGRQDLHDAFFAGHARVRVSREWLHREAADGSPELRIFGIIAWGYPMGVRAMRHVQWLERLPAITAAATLPAPWDFYHANVATTGGMGIATISMLAHFLGHSFEGQRALILDGHIISLCAEQRWLELAPLGDITPAQAHRRYLDYLRLMHAIAASGSFSSEQLEFFLNELGGAF